MCILAFTCKYMKYVVVCGKLLNLKLINYEEKFDFIGHCIWDI